MTIVEREQKHCRMVLLLLRLAAACALVALLSVHLRSLRAFRWEQTVSGGVLITYFVGMVGLALATGLQYNVQRAFQVYMSATGAVLLALNAAVILRRWRTSGQLTRVVAELLGAVGVPLRRQVYAKVALGGATAALLMIDVLFTVVCFA